MKKQKPLTQDTTIPNYLATGINVHNPKARLWVSQGISIAEYQNKPNSFHRFMQRLLLGWIWTDD